MFTDMTDEIITQNKPKEFNMVKLSMTFDKCLHSDYVVDSIEKAIYLVNDYLSDCPNEVMMGIALDSDRKPISCSVLGVGNEHSIGDVSSNVLRFALLSCADSIILIHNHPRSSRLDLSNADINQLNNLQQIASMIGIIFRDFIVVGNQKQNHAYYSWYEKRLISQEEFLDSLKYIDVEQPIVADQSYSNGESIMMESFYNSPDSFQSDKKNERDRRKGFFHMLG